MKITKADMSTFYILNEGTTEYEPFTSIAANEEMLRPFNSENPAGEFGNALSTKKIFHLKDIPDKSSAFYFLSPGDRYDLAKRQVLKGRR